MERSALLVVERDADWTQWTVTTSRLGPPIIALIQEPEEPAFEFAARVKARVDLLLQQGKEIRQLALLGADDWEVPTLQARLEILRKARESFPKVEAEFHLDADRPDGEAPRARSKPAPTSPAESPVFRPTPGRQVAREPVATSP